MKHRIAILSLLVTLLIILTAAIPVQSKNALIRAPRISVKEGTSTNWAGYAVPISTTKKSQTIVTDVQSWWKVPAAQPSNIDSWSSNWVGIDGYSSSSVEQIGTESDWSGGAPRYYAWWEMYPKPSYLIPYTVNSGDNMYGDVSYSNGNFILTLTDYGSGKTKAIWTFQITQKSGKAQQNSAEWIVEAPWSGGVLPLANFGTTGFTGATATIGNVTGSIGSWDSAAFIDMVDSNGNIIAKTSSLSGKGSSFTVTWQPPLN